MTLSELFLHLNLNVFFILPVFFFICRFGDEVDESMVCILCVCAVVTL